MFIATGSFFLGQQQVFPVAMRGSAILLILGVLALPLLFFWLLRLRFADSYQVWRIEPAVQSASTIAPPGEPRDSMTRERLTK